MGLFDAHEFDRHSLRMTGNRQRYIAENAETAAKHCLYTRRLKNDKAFLGPTKRVVYDGNKGWVITTAKGQA